MEEVTDVRVIGKTRIYYGLGGMYSGGINVAKIGDSYGWTIEDNDTLLDDPNVYEIIPEYLYQALLRFEDEREG